MHSQTTETETMEAERALLSTLDGIARKKQHGALRTIQAQPVLTALQSEEPHTETVAKDTARHFLAVLQQVEQKKAGVEETMEVLLREIKMACRRKRRQVVASLSGTCAALFLMLMISRWTDYHVFDFSWPFLLFWGGWAGDRTAKTRREAAMALRRAGDSRAVGVLAVAAREGGDSIVRRAAENALLTLLPRARPHDAAYITTEQMHALLALADHHDVALRVALLRALEQIGDERAIPIVYNMMEDDWREVREQAEQCLPFLEERIRNVQEGKTLLRASSKSPSGTQAHELLRAAATSQHSEVPADQLLRPIPGD